MSILTRSIGKPKEKAPGADVADETAISRTARRGGPAPALATSPRANLLPPEIGQNQRRLAVRRGLRFAIVVAVVVAILGIGGAWYSSFTAQNALAAAQQRSADLSAQKNQYRDVVSALNAITLGEAAEKVGGSTDIDWEAYLNRLQATLPNGVTLTEITAVSADAQTSFAQSTTPLEGPRIATLTFSATSAQLPEIPKWIDGLSSLPGFADASPDSITHGDDGYTAAVTMHINTDAFSQRFDAEKEKDK